MTTEGKNYIKKIRGNVYRFGWEDHHSIMVVGDKYSLIADPINSSTARWISDVAIEKFGRPIQYVVYSHDHLDHIAGGEIFPSTTTIIAHERAAWVIRKESRPTRYPNLTFSDRLTINVSGEIVDLMYLGLNSTDNTIIAHLPQEKILFAVDILSVASLPHRQLRYIFIEQWIETLKKIEQIEFDVVAPGHGPTGVKQDVIDHRVYIEELYESVWRFMRDGLQIDEILKRITMDRYAHWTGYEKWLEGNIVGTYNYIDHFRRPN